MTEAPGEPPVPDDGAPERPVAQRPAAGPPPVPTRPSERRAAAAAASPPSGSRMPREIPRWFWMLLVLWLTMVVLLLIDVLTGWGDTPAGCSNHICTLGQGVGLLSLIGTVVLGLAVGFSFFAIAARAASTNRRARGGTS